MHSAGISHTAASAYCYVPHSVHQNFNTNASVPSPIGFFSSASYSLPLAHDSGSSIAGIKKQTDLKMDRQPSALHSQVYRHMLSQNQMMANQYDNPSALDMAYQQKCSPSLLQYEELISSKLERPVQQDHGNHQLGSYSDVEPKDKMRLKQEKAQNDSFKQELGRRKNPAIWRDRESVSKECTLRKVQQHFDESLRFVTQKHQFTSWRPVPNLPQSQTEHRVDSSSPAVSLSLGIHTQSSHAPDHEMEGILNKDVERYSSRGTRISNERWPIAVQHGSELNIPDASYPKQCSSLEMRGGVSNLKDPHSLLLSNVSPVANKYRIASSLANSAACDASSMQRRSEASFSLYGYQPFQHSYVTHAQLKAREECKALNNAHSRVGTSNEEDKSFVFRNTSSPGNRTTSAVFQNSGKQLKLMRKEQEYNSSTYQPFISSGGAFKPYECSNSHVPAPPAHQNSTAAISKLPVQYHPHQQQPENLVKMNYKSSHSPHMHDRAIKETSSTPVSCISLSCTTSNSLSAMSTANSNYRYSLIQQGLVPNPLYIASTGSGNTSVKSSVSTFMSAPMKGSSSGTQYFLSSDSSSISSVTPVCEGNYFPRIPPHRKNCNQYSALHSVVSADASKLSLESTEYPSTSSSSQGRSLFSKSSQQTPACGFQPFHSVHSVGSVVQGISSVLPEENSVSDAQGNGGCKSLSPVSNKTSSCFPHAEAPDHQAAPVNFEEVSNCSKEKQRNELDCKEYQWKTDQNAQLQQRAFPISISPVSEASKSYVFSNLKPDVGLTDNSTHSLRIHSIRQGCSIQENCEKETLESCVTQCFSDTAYDNTLSDADGAIEEVIIPIKSSSEELKENNESIEVIDQKNEVPNSSACCKMRTTNESQNQKNLEKNEVLASLVSTVCSTVMCNSICGSKNHTKLKKAWLQRHSENEDRIDIKETEKYHCSSLLSSPKAKSDTSFVSAKSASYSMFNEEIEVQVENLNKQKMNFPKLELKAESSSTPTCEMENDSNLSKRKHAIDTESESPAAEMKRQKLSVSNDVSGDPTQCIVQNEICNEHVSESDLPIIKRRGRKPKCKNILLGDSPKKHSKSESKLCTLQLKEPDESFLQDGPCFEVAPRLPKCRECRMTPHQRNKKMPNIFCRFYAYRKLRYGRNGTILSAGFSEPSDATDDDQKIWLPLADSLPTDAEVETSKFLLTHIGDQFCDLVEMEKAAQAMHMSEDTTITWKRVVQGVREMCDVCETTLFNIHWVCHKCGFVVCIDCYRAREKGIGKGKDSYKDRDAYQWLFCNNRQAHEQDKLMLTQIIASSALWDVGKTLHDVRHKWNIPTYCNCSIKVEKDGKNSNGICKLMDAVTKCFDKETSDKNLPSKSSSSSQKCIQALSIDGLRSEESFGEYNSESASSPLSWLADVALSSSKDGEKSNKLCINESKLEDQDSNSDRTDGYEEKDENFSTLRELLIRPMGKLSTKNDESNNSSQKTLTSTLDEVISCVIEQRVRKSDGKGKEKQLFHYTPRLKKLRSGRELLPIRSCILAESSLLYPEVPHIWLGNGKILLLTDSCHFGNLQMFQEQWKRGQPVVISSVGQKLDRSLWNPISFSRDFGDMKNDFYDCVCGTVVQNLPMKKFWEGFECLKKRMKDEDGNYMVLKLKDWPAGEEFSELLPNRYHDLMKVLPLPQYTHRDGVLNMASHLPDCFVRPDLGPRMYSAYGLSSSCSKGSTYLHLDVSDAVNILAYIGKLTDDKDISETDIMRALDENGCDYQMKKRSEENNLQVGAIWHVYNARDADKIRDLLNKVAEEQGVKCDPHHDPIHYQEWYLDESLRERLHREYDVEGYAIAQCLGDALFIPAGSPYQVKDLKSCVKISEDFVSPESLGLSFFLTQEIRNLSDCPSNPEDGLQVKNIIYHAVKDALSVLLSSDPKNSKP